MFRSGRISGVDGPMAISWDVVGIGPRVEGPPPATGDTSGKASADGATASAAVEPVGVVMVALASVMRLTSISGAASMPANPSRSVRRTCRRNYRPLTKRKSAYAMVSTKRRVLTRLRASTVTAL